MFILGNHGLTLLPHARTQGFADSIAIHHYEMFLGVWHTVCGHAFGRLCACVVCAARQQSCCAAYMLCVQNQSTQRLNAGRFRTGSV